MEIIKNEHLDHAQLITCENCMHRGIKINNKYYLCNELDIEVSSEFFCSQGALTWETDGKTVKINGK